MVQFFWIYSVLTSKVSIISLEYGQQMSCQVPKFVDPRIETHSTFAIEEEPSLLSSLSTSCHRSDSRSLTCEVAQFPFLDERPLTSLHTFGLFCHDFSLEVEDNIPISFPQPYEGTTATMGNGMKYLPCPESSPSSTQPSSMNTELTPLPSSLVHRRGPGRPSKPKFQHNS